MVFQQFNLLESRTVYENVALPLILNKTECGADGADRNDTAPVCGSF